MKKYIVLIITFILLQINSVSKECLVASWEQHTNQQFQKAIESINSCIDEIISDAKPEEMDYAFYGLANNYIRLGEVDSALKYILIAHDIEKKHNLNQSKTLNELGLIYIEKGLNHQALYYFKKAMELNKQSNNKKSLGLNLSNIGFAYTNLQMKDSATVYLNLAVELMKISPAKRPLLINNIANAFFQNKDYSKSFVYFKKSNSNINFENNELDKYLIRTNLEIVKLFNNIEINNFIFDDYLAYTKNNENSIYFADANYKMSIIASRNKNLEEGVKYLNVANAIYVELGNILKAKEITKTFLLANKINNTSNLKYSESELSELLNIDYSKQLEKDLEVRIASESYIANIENKLYYSEISLYVILSILMSVLFTISFAYYRIKKNNYINMLVQGYNNYLEIIYQLDSNRLRLNLSKITNYMALDKSFRDKELFTELVDEVVKDTNMIRKTVKNGIDFQQTKRLKNV